MANIVPAVGSTSLGVVMGFLVRYFIRRFDTFAPGVLSSVISIVLGGAVIKFLGADKNVWWFYPIGLLLGFVAYQIIATVHTSGGSRGGAIDVSKIFNKNDPRYMR